MYLGRIFIVLAESIFILYYKMYQHKHATYAGSGFVFAAKSKKNFQDAVSLVFSLKYCYRDVLVIFHKWKEKKKNEIKQNKTKPN